MKRKLRKTTALLSAMALSAAMLLNIPGSMMVNAADDNEHHYTNGICTDLGCNGMDKYEAPDQDSDGVYIIENAGNLFRFARNVNDGSTTINAKLKNDIDISSFDDWTPIGNTTAKAYGGDFDGQNHKISGLNITLNVQTAEESPAAGTTEEVTPSVAKVYGLFGRNKGTIHNLGVSSPNIVNNCKATVGVICGDNTGTISNCYSHAEGTVAKGISGTNNGTISYCYSTAESTSYQSVEAGNVSPGTTLNSYFLNYDNISRGENEFGYPATADRFKSGYVAYKLQGDQESQVWGQKIGSDDYPVLGGDKVYEYTSAIDNSSKIYSNSSTAPAEAEILGYNISLSNIDEIQLSVKLTVANANGFKVFVGEKEVTPEPVDGNGNYTVSYPVAAKDIDERRTFTVRAADGTLLDSKVLSVSGYLDALKNDVGSTTYYSALADALLAYGKAAKQYFANETVDAVNFNADLSKYKMVLNDENLLEDGVEYIGTSLLLNSKTTLRHYFKHPVFNLFTVDGEVVEPTEFTSGSGIYYIDSDEISPRNMSNTSNVQIDDTTVLEYSVLSYAEAVISGSDKNLANLAKALYNYHKAASAIPEIS